MGRALGCSPKNSSLYLKAEKNLPQGRSVVEDGQRLTHAAKKRLEFQSTSFTFWYFGVEVGVFQSNTGADAPINNLLSRAILPLFLFKEDRLNLDKAVF